MAPAGLMESSTRKRDPQLLTKHQSPQTTVTIQANMPGVVTSMPCVYTLYTAVLNDVGNSSLKEKPKYRVLDHSANQHTLFNIKSAFFLLRTNPKCPISHLSPTRQTQGRSCAWGRREFPQPPMKEDKGPYPLAG